MVRVLLLKSVFIEAVGPVTAQGEPAISRGILRIRQNVCKVRVVSEAGR